MKRINKIVSAFLNLLQVVSYVSLWACNGNQELDKSGELLLEEKTTKNVQNEKVRDKSNEAEKNFNAITNLLTTYQSLKKGNNKDKCAKDDPATYSSTEDAKDKINTEDAKDKINNENKPRSSRHKRNEYSISEYSVYDLKTTPIVSNLSIDFDVTGKLTISKCLYRVTNEDEFKIFLEYLEKAKKEKAMINGLASIFPKEKQELTENNDSVRLWKKDWFWKSINAHWDLFKDLKLQKFSIKSYIDTKNEEKIYIEGLGYSDIYYFDVLQKGVVRQKSFTSVASNVIKRSNSNRKIINEQRPKSVNKDFCNVFVFNK